MKHKLYSKSKLIAFGTAVVLAGAGLLSSCNKLGEFLEIEPQNEITLAKFWNEKNDVEQILSGCYSTMQSYAIISRMMIWGEYRSENVLWNGTGDEDNNLERILKENITASNAYTTWGEFYTIINRCNTVIEYAPGVAEKDPAYTQSQLKAHIAEAVALRSLMYFYLIRTFRDVPYNEEAYLDDSQTMDLEPMEFDKVLSILISSLEEVKDDAVEAYPDDGTTNAKNYDTGRITKWAIYAMLCDMYLWQKDYAKCIEYAELIINHKKEEAKNSKVITSAEMQLFNGYPLIGTCYRNKNNSYGRSFNYIFVDGNSEESIFELSFVKGSGSNQLSNGPFSNFYGGQGRTPWVVASKYSGRDEVDGLYKVFNSSNKQFDARSYENICFNSDKSVKYVNKTTGKSSINIGPITTSSTAEDIIKNTTWGSQYETEGSNHDSRSKANFIFYRLTDIMLLEAEAYTQMISEGSQDLTSETDLNYLRKAFSLVNAVNKRSVMEQPSALKDTLVFSNYTTKGEITNLVYEERNRELMFEGKHYYDLVRRSRRDGNTDYLCSKCQNKSTDLQSVIKSKMQKMDAIYWPYNLDEIKVNSHITQNPAFGSGENSSYSNDAQ